MFIVEAFFFKSSACSARNTRRQSRRRNRSKTRSMESRLYVFHSRLQRQRMVNLYKRIRFVITHTICHPTSSYAVQPNDTKRRHVDATIIRSFRKCYFPHFLPSTDSGHVSLAAVRPEMATLLNSLYFVLKISFLPKYHVKCGATDIM